MGWRPQVVYVAGAAALSLLAVACSDDLVFASAIDVRVVVAGSGAGSGTVVALDAVVGIDCTLTADGISGVCDRTFEDNNSLGTFTLRAASAGGSDFLGWDIVCRDKSDHPIGPALPLGDCSATVSGPDASLSFDHPEDLTYTVTARFEPVPDLPPADGDTVFYESFNDIEVAEARWDVEYSSTDVLITQTSESRETGGNPGGYRHMAHIWETSGSVSVRHFNTAAVFDPGAAGNCEIDRIDYTEDRARIDPQTATGSVGSNVILRQGGRLFYIADSEAVTGEGWMRFLREGLRPADFLPEPGPDYSADGGPIEFGYLRTNTTGATTRTIEHGIDNWRIEIHCVAP